MSGSVAANGNRGGDSGEGGGHRDRGSWGDTGRGEGVRRGDRPPLQADSQDTIQLPLGLSLHPTHHRRLILNVLQVREVFPKQIFHIHDTEFLQHTNNSISVHHHVWHCHKMGLRTSYNIQKKI